MSFFDKYFKNAFGWLFPGDGTTNFLKPFKAISDVFSNAFGNNGEKGWLSDLFDSSGTEFSGLLSALTNRITAEHMTGAEREAALLSYQQQEQFFNHYQSIPAQVQQSLEAGLNPALMYGKGASPMSPISGNASAGQPSIDPAQMISLLAGLSFKSKEVRAEQLLKGSQANLLNAQAEAQRNENSVWAEKFEFWRTMQTKTFNKIDAETFLTNAQGRLAEQGIKESEAKTTLLTYQAATEKVHSEYAAKSEQSLLDLRESAQELNKANAEYSRSQSAESKQRLQEAQQSWGTRWRTLQESLVKLEIETGMAENEAKAFWTDKRINELLVMSEIFENYKTDFKAFGIGGSQSNWFERSIARDYPSMYAPLYEK